MTPLAGTMAATLTGTLTVTLAVALAGGLGAVARFVVDGVVPRHPHGTQLLTGTLVVNTAGSFLLGLTTALAARHAIDPDLARIVGVGFCGGFTTFSTASLEAVKIWFEDGTGRATAYTLLMVIGSICAAGLGLWTAEVL